MTQSPCWTLFVQQTKYVFIWIMYIKQEFASFIVMHWKYLTLKKLKWANLKESLGLKKKTHSLYPDISFHDDLFFPHLKILTSKTLEPSFKFISILLKSFINIMTI